MNGFAERGPRVRTFSLRMLLLVVTLLACCFAFYAFGVNQVRQHDAAVARIQAAGARPHLTTPEGLNLTEDHNVKSTLISMLTANPAVVVPLVDLSDTALTANGIRKLIPDLQRLIPSDLNETGNPYVALKVSGNPNISPELIEEMRKRLPNCQFVKYSPVPIATPDVIEPGMSQDEVIGTIGTLKYDQRTDWVGDKAQTVNMLGSLNNKYTDSGGLETWTYFTDDIGVGVLGIDFDADRQVAKVWSDRGVPWSRGLTPKGPPGGYSGY